MTYYACEFSDLKGRTITKYEKYDDSLIFHTKDYIFEMYHKQNCCETVSIKDIDGDLDDLIGHELFMAEESSNLNDTEYDDERWTFYKLATKKGYVTISWYGESNGYYSIEVSLKCKKLDGCDSYGGWLK